MSGDESDHHNPTSRRGDNRQYFRVRPAWRNPGISAWLDIFDKVYISLRYDGAEERASRGNWIRLRTSTNKEDSTSMPITGLPMNFYAPNFVRKLKPKQQAALNMKAPIDLDHTQDMIEYVPCLYVDASDS